MFKWISVRVTRQTMILDAINILHNILLNELKMPCVIGK